MAAMDHEAFQDLLLHEPFQAFRIHTHDGKTYEVKNPGLVNQLKTQVFFAFPNSDRFALIPLRSISSVEIMEHAA
ncbi:MAG TPA: hypothetical protein VGN88_01515 [Phycisphaerae bacterium]